MKTLPAEENKPLTDNELIQELINGASLRTFMVPDDSIPSNYPEHTESFDLPHIIIKGDYFWGKSEAVHVGYHFGDDILPLASYCYTNIGNIFCSYTPSTGRACLMSKKRYRKHEWHIKKDYRLIWDSKKNESPEIIKDEIEHCSKIKIAMLDSEGIWNIHPINLPMYYAGEGNFVLNSSGDSYPMFFREPNQTIDFLKKESEFFNTKPLNNANGVLNYGVKPFYSFYVLKSDGTYFNYYDIPRGTSQKYKHLKVFSDRL